MRALLGLLSVVLLTLLFGAPALLAGVFDRSGRMPHRFVRLWARLVLGAFGVQVETSGLENLVDGPVLYAANHSSALDIPIVFGYLPADFRVIHKKSLILIPIIGWFLFLAGHIPIDRSRAFRAKRSLESAARRIAGGTSVVAFPEGTRSSDGRVGPFKRGSFLLALNAGVPVVPLSLVGVKRLIPRGVLSFRSGTVRLQVLPAVPLAGRSPEEAQTLADEVREAVVKACGNEAA
jgi:1-acyl-sn-glycerol-3-phosphate acyltransferase